jgi:hypothetical protein
VPPQLAIHNRTRLELINNSSESTGTCQLLLLDTGRVTHCRFANYLAHFCSNYVALQTAIWVTCQLPIECSLAWKARILLNSIRFLANDLRLPLVCAGTHEAKQALMTDQQLADRFEAAELPAWENDSNFQQLLLSFESILPLRLPSEFRDPKVHQRILSLTEGVLVRICRLIETAATEAIHGGQEHISLPLLKDDLVTGSLVSIVDRRNRRVSAR